MTAGTEARREELLNLFLKCITKKLNRTYLFFEEKRIMEIAIIPEHKKPNQKREKSGIQLPQIDLLIISHSPSLIAVP